MVKNICVRFTVGCSHSAPLRCNKGRVGRQCECRKDEVSTEDLDKNCRKDNGTDICSNNGECVCGTCECKKRDNPEERYSGKFCECDNFNCDRSNNKLCGGTGSFLHNVTQHAINTGKKQQIAVHGSNLFMFHINR